MLRKTCQAQFRHQLVPGQAIGHLSLLPLVRLRLDARMMRAHDVELSGRSNDRDAGFARPCLRALRSHCGGRMACSISLPSVGQPST
jgi:hypothetical protein